MDLKDLVDEVGLQQDKWSLTKPIFGKRDQLQVVGWSSKHTGYKLYIVKCSKCSGDTELFGEGYFKRSKGDLVKNNLNCGCAANTPWSTDQYAVLCSRKALEKGYEFLGFVDAVPNSKTILILKCKSHGEWRTTAMSSFINANRGCAGCKGDECSARTTKPDAEVIKTFLRKGYFSLETSFWRSDRETGQGYKSYWYILCQDCGEIGEAYASDLQKGHRPCGCSKQKQLEAYIHLLLDNDVPIALKFGIAMISDRRKIRQEKYSVYKIEALEVYTFLDKQSCRRAERECKKELECGILPKEEMADGYTETTWVYNLEKIVEIYKRNGGIKR